MFLSLLFISPMGHTASSWSPASFSLTETWNDYQTNDLNSGSDSSTLTTNGGSDRSMGLYLTGGTTNGGGEYLLTHSGGDTLAMSNLVFSWSGGSFDYPTDGGPWTGSMGEGIVIGMDGAAGAHTIASDMGDLLGAIYNEPLGHCDASLELGVESLFHVDGTPREDYVADTPLTVADLDAAGEDPAMAAIRKVLAKGL